MNDVQLRNQWRDYKEPVKRVCVKMDKTNTNTMATDLIVEICNLDMDFYKKQIHKIKMSNKKSDIKNILMNEYIKLIEKKQKDINDMLNDK